MIKLKAATKKIIVNVFAVLGAVLLAGIVYRNRTNERGIFAGVLSDLQQIIGIK